MREQSSLNAHGIGNGMVDQLVLTNPQGKEVTTSFIVAKVFGKPHFHVLRDIKELHCSDAFRETNFGFMYSIRELPNGGSKKDPYYKITKDGFSFLVMGYTGAKAADFKERFINEFNKRESLLKDNDYIINRAMNILAERTKILETNLQRSREIVQIQEKEIKEAAPKVNYYDKVLNSESLISTTIIAKELGLTAIALNNLLHQDNIIYKSGNTWVLYQHFQKYGFTKTKTYVYTDSHGKELTNVHTYWTEKGRNFIHKALKASHPELFTNVALTE
jgi:Rha family phage regulatory protein